MHIVVSYHTESTSNQVIHSSIKMLALRVGVTLRFRDVYAVDSFTIWQSGKSLWIEATTDWPCYHCMRSAIRKSPDSPELGQNHGIKHLKKMVFIPHQINHIIVILLHIMSKDLNGVKQDWLGCRGLRVWRDKEYLLITMKL